MTLTLRTTKQKWIFQYLLVIIIFLFKFETFIIQVYLISTLTFFLDAGALYIWTYNQTLFSLLLSSQSNASEAHLKPISLQEINKVSTKSAQVTPNLLAPLTSTKAGGKMMNIIEKKIPQLLFNLLQVKNLSQYFFQLSRSDWSANGQTFLIILVQHVSDLLLAEKGTKSGHKKKVKCNSERRDFYDKTLIPQDWNYLTRKCMQQEMKL